MKQTMDQGLESGWQVFRYLILLWGWTYLLIASAILVPLRELIARVPVIGLGIYCAACTGFWVGAALGATGHWPWSTAYAAGEAAVAGAGVMAALGHWMPLSEPPGFRGRPL